jgi:hypothetical protein
LTVKRGTGTRRLATSWRLAESLIAALTQPRTDVECEDAAFEQLLRQSAIAHGARRSQRAFSDAWASSRLRFEFERYARDLRALGPEAGLRAASWVIVVASATALALGAVKPAPAGPLSWLLPAACAAAGVVALVVAGPLTRAFGARQS